MPTRSRRRWDQQSCRCSGSKKVYADQRSPTLVPGLPFPNRLI